MRLNKHQNENIKQPPRQYIQLLSHIMIQDMPEDEKEYQILVLMINYSNSQNPNDYNQKAIKKMVFHMDVDKYSNPTFEGYNKKVLKIYNNYKKQQEQEQIKINKSAFNVAY